MRQVAQQPHSNSIFNTAALGDNDRMYHRVRPVGRRDDGLPMGMTLDTRLEYDGAERWAIRRSGETLATMDFAELRVSVSWKAYVYRPFFRAQAESGLHDFFVAATKSDAEGRYPVPSSGDWVEI